MFAELLRSGQKDTADPVSRIEELRENPVIASELLDLLTISEHSRNAVPVICDPAPDGIPFETGCTYTRNQILIAMDRLCTWREGVKYFKNRKADVFLITINKSESDFTSSTGMRTTRSTTGSSTGRASLRREARAKQRIAISIMRKGEAAFSSLSVNEGRIRRRNPL